MIISNFKLDDLGCFLPNQYSDPDAVLPQLVNGDWEVFSGWGLQGQVVAIGAVSEYHPRCYSGFFLVSVEFTPEHGHELRGHLLDFMQARKAIRMQTQSRADATLREWHRYLGFSLEGTLRKFMFGLDYDSWAIVQGVQ